MCRWAVHLLTRVMRDAGRGHYGGAQRWGASTMMKGSMERARLFSWSTDTLNSLWPNPESSSPSKPSPLSPNPGWRLPTLPHGNPGEGQTPSRNWEPCVDVASHSPSPSIIARVGLFEDCHWMIALFWTRGLNKRRYPTKNSRWHQNVTFSSRRDSAEAMALDLWTK